MAMRKQTIQIEIVRGSSSTIKLAWLTKILAEAMVDLSMWDQPVRIEAKNVKNR